MNDQTQMMNQPPQNQMMKQQPPPPSQQMMGLQSQQMLSMTQPSPMLNQQQQRVMMMNPPQSQQMLNRGVGGGGGYGMWPPVVEFPNPMNYAGGGFVVGRSSSKHLNKQRSGNNWKGNIKGGKDNRKDLRRRNEMPLLVGGSNVIAPGGAVGVSGRSVNSGGGGYRPPTLNELQNQNRLKAKKYFNKKKFYNNRSAPFAPRNTSSYLIRSKKSGGIGSLVSPCPVTPAVLPTPIFSPSREVLVDTAKEEWGVDGYGSMKGLIRLRSPGQEVDGHEEDEEEEGGSSESDVEEHLEVERRLDHDLSRFEMIYPNYSAEYNNVLENRVDDQYTHIAHVEEENLLLKERLFLMERELGDLRRRLLSLERQQHRAVEDINEEVVENESDNESESRGYPSMEENNEEVIEENNDGNRYADIKEVNKDGYVVEANGKNNDRDSEVKVVNDVKESIGRDNGYLEPTENHFEITKEIIEGGGVQNESQEKQTNGNVEVKEADSLQESRSMGVVDVCMEEIAPVQDDVVAENKSGDCGAEMNA